MINGVNNYSQNYLNMLYKYQQAIGTNGLASTATNSLGSAGSVSAINGIAKTTNAFNNYTSNLTLNATAKKFLNRYTSAYQELANTANSLRTNNANSIWKNVAGSSSDESIVTVKNNYRTRMQGEYDVHVRQLAQEQQNQSLALASDEISDIASGALEIKIGARRTTLNVDTSGKTNEQVFADLADAINANYLGITAKVETSEGKSQLMLSGQKTGMNQDFILTGDIADKLGLNQVTQQAQDALVDVVNKKTGATETLMEGDNTLSLDSYRTSLEIKEIGKAELSFGVNSDDLVSTVQDMVDQYNDTVKLLNDNYDLGTGVGQQLQNLLQPPISEASMALVGLSYRDDGTLALDGEKLTEAYQTDAKQVESLLGSRYSVADGIGDKAMAALRQSSLTLLDKQMQGNSSGNSNNWFTTNPFEILNNYGRLSGYQMKNYNYIGFLMDTFV